MNQNKKYKVFEGFVYYLHDLSNMDIFQFDVIIHEKECFYWVREKKAKKEVHCIVNEDEFFESLMNMNLKESE